MVVWIYCSECNIRIVKHSNAHKYCKKCAYIVNLQKTFEGKKNKNLKRNNTLGPHMKRKTDGSPDFTAEQKAIKKEIKKIGLRK